MSTPAAVAVLGSCITRDNFNSRFNPDYRDFYTCPIHQNQSSIISLMSEPLDVAWAPTANMSDYDRWNVETEFTKSFLTEAPAARPDYLVLDFFGDVHFGVVRVGEDGAYVTNNSWKVQQTDWYAEASAAGRLHPLRGQDDPDAYLELWRASFERFLAWFRAELPETTLVVHRGHYTASLRRAPGERPVPLRSDRTIKALNVKRANRLWRRLDDAAIEMSGARVIDLLDRRYPTYPEHPWGAFYVHYEPLYYHRFLAELHKIHLDKEVDPALRPMLADVERVRVAAERSAADAAAARIGALRRRVAALEAAQSRRPAQRARRAAARLLRR